MLSMKTSKGIFNDPNSQPKDDKSTIEGGMMVKVAVIKVKIQNGVDRQNVVTALANAGNKVWVEIKEGDFKLAKNREYYVCFEMVDSK